MSVNNSCKLTNRNNLFNNAVPVFVRFVGWLKNFIHNRSLASENLIYAGLQYHMHGAPYASAGSGGPEKSGGKRAVLHQGWRG